MKTRDAVRALNDAGLTVAPGSKHLKVTAPDGRMVAVLSAHPKRSSGHDPHAIAKIIRSVSLGGQR